VNSADVEWGKRRVQKADSDKAGKKNRKATGIRSLEKREKTTNNLGEKR